MEKGKILYPLYIVFLLLMTLYIGVKPYYNMDMLPYMAIVQKLDGKASIEQIHQNTYAEVREQVAKPEFSDLTSATPYRKALYANALSFHEQLSFYIVKPLYLFSVYLFYQLGASLPYATVLPSLLSYFIIGLVLLRWINRILPSSWLTLWACLFIISSEPLIELGKSSAPDGMATAFLLGGCYLFIEKKLFWKSTLLFVLSILSRPDYIILTSLILLIAALGKWHRKIRPGKLFLCFFLLLAAYLVPKLFYKDVAWSVLFHHAFVERVLFPLSDPPALSATDYLAVLAKNIIDSTYFARTHLLLLLLFAGVTFWNRSRFLDFHPANWTFNQALMLALLLAVGLRFLLFPAFLVRFMAPFLVLGGLIFLKEIYLLLEALYKRKQKELSLKN